MTKKPPPKHRQEKPERKVTTGQIVALCILSLLLFGVVFLDVFIYKVVNPSIAFSNSVKAPDILPETPEPPKESPSQTFSASTASPSPSPSVDPYDALLAQSDMNFMKNKVNILVVGLDKSTEREAWGSFRTDTMIVAACDFQNKTLHMISLPRDSLVYIYPFKKMGKINSAFVSGGGAQKNGYAYAMKTASHVLGGIPIDYYLGFDMTVVKKLVDAMGGVDYNVDIEVTMNGRTLQKGQQHLSGQQVLDYCRQRHGSSDIARVDRQQRMLFEIFNHMKSSGQFKNLPEIFKTLQQNIQTNLDFTQICSLAFFAKDLDLSKMQRYTLPGSFLNLNETSYWGVNLSATKKMINEIFGVNINTDDRVDAGSLKPLASKMEQLKSDMLKKLSAGQSYLTQNAAYIDQAQKTKYSELKSALMALASQSDIEDFSGAVSDLEAKIAEYDTWYNALKQTVEGKKLTAAQ